MQELFTECKSDNYYSNDHRFSQKKGQYREKVTWPTLPPNLYRGQWGKSTIREISPNCIYLLKVDHARGFSTKLQ